MELTFKEFLRGGKEQLAAAGFAEVEAEHLLAHTLGLTRMDLHNPLTVENALTAIGDIAIVEETFWKLLDRRCANEPLQYLTGVAYFRHLEIKVGPGVLVPRPESELLVESVLTHIEKMNIEKFSSAISVVDLGAGSGALALAIATEAPTTHVIAVEKSAAAIYWLKENVSFIDEKVRIVESDVSTALDGVKCDVVIANPPYIPDEQELPADVRDHEPAIALFGGVNGMKAPRLFIAASARLLKPGGFLAIEHHEEQGDEIAAVLNLDFQDILLHQDLTGRPRFTTAVRR
jgi:release factor glutamine methyltransferase